MHVLTDHLGTPVKLVDSTKVVVWSRVQTPFGLTYNESTSGAWATSVRFPGQMRDAETDLNYNYFRDYDPSLGRYIESDPIGLNGGMNTYGYVRGNPVRYFDPFGLEVTMVCRPVDDWRVKPFGAKHCAVFVWHWEDGNICPPNKIIDAQFSFAGQQTRLTNPNGYTYSTDLKAFNNPGGGNEHYQVPPPPWMTQGKFDEAVIDAGNSYKLSAPYNAFLGPNSNTASDDIIEDAGGQAPDIRGAYQQHYGDNLYRNGGRNFPFHPRFNPLGSKRTEPENATPDQSCCDK